LSVSSNGNSAGILWAVASDGVLHALNASNIASAELWNSNLNSCDKLGSVGHFQWPTIANGKVYVGNGNAQVLVYGVSSSSASCSSASSASTLSSWTSYVQ